MADQRRDQGVDADRTEVMPTVEWPSAEPDPPKASPGHIDYLDTPDGPMQAPAGGVYTPASSYAEQPTDAYATQPPADGQGARPADGYGSQPTDGRGGQPTEAFGGPPADGRGGQPTEVFGGPPADGCGGQPTEAFGGPPADGRGGQPTDVYGGQPPAGQPPTGQQPVGQEPAADRSWKQRLLRPVPLVAAAVFGLLVLLYGGDLALARGEVPRGVTVAGVEIGGMDRADAEQRLRDQLGPRLSQPIEVRAGDVDASIDPREAGLELDWPATIDQAGDQPLNPWTRLRSLFGSREVGAVTRTDPAKLTGAVEALQAKTDHEPSEGTVRFEGIAPVAVDPIPGQSLDVPKAVDALVAGWASGAVVQLPVSTTPVLSTPESVRAALDGIAKPAVSGPVTVTGEGGQATLTPEVIATALTFEVGEDGALNPKYDNDKIVEALRPQLTDTEQPGKDASIAIEGGHPVVRPSVDGRGVDWVKSLETLPTVLRGTDNRVIPATYVHQPAQFTTEAANALGIREVIGEFTTGGFASDSGVNIRVIAAEVNGAVLRPGEKFSLNGHTGPRGLAQGYIEAGIIERGRPGRAVGGGCSQFATTLYNAAYFAGMTDVTHKEHSYYISRYPEAREATVYEGLIDLAFRNDAPTGVLIQTAWTPTSITVKIWGTKHYNVESVTGGRSNFTEPGTVTIPYGEKCTPGSGAQGFTVSNTRIVRDARTGAEIKRSSRTVVYNPIPKIVCEPAPTTEPPPPG